VLLCLGFESRPGRQHLASSMSASLAAAWVCAPALLMQRVCAFLVSWVPVLCCGVARGFQACCAAAPAGLNLSLSVTKSVCNMVCCELVSVSS
jgi:hypothetical protein